MLDFINNKTDIICAVLLGILIIVLIICLVRNTDYFEENNKDKELNKLHDYKFENNNNKNGNKNGNKNILLIAYMGCQFCKKAKNLMDEIQLDYELIESNSDEGRKYMEQNDSNGVPLILDLKTNTVIKGFNHQKIKQLKN